MIDVGWCAKSNLSSEVESSVSMLCLKFESVKSGVMFCKPVMIDVGWCAKSNLSV
jgi:hypothetical protein